MPAWVIILLFAAALIGGYMAMAGLDRTLDSQKEASTCPIEAETLLFGHEEDIFIAREWLKKHDFCYDEVDTPTLPVAGNFHLLLALSNSDVDNLLLCAAARQRFETIKTAARLTDSVYLPVFKDAGVDYILPDVRENEITELLNHVHPRV